MPDTEPPTDEYLTVPEVAARIGRSVRMTQLRIQLGEIAAEKHGQHRTAPYMVRASEVERYLQYASASAS